jgi:hypothetical protein
MVKKFPKEIEHTSGVTMVLDESRVLIAFKKPSPIKTKKKRITADKELEKIGLIREAATEETIRKRVEIRRFISETPNRVWIKKLDGETIKVKTLRDLKRLYEGKIEWVGAVYRPEGTTSPEEAVCFLPHVLLIKPRGILSNKELNKLERLLDEMGLIEHLGKSRYLVGYRYFEIKDLTKSTSYELISNAKRNLKNLVEDVKFESMPLVKPITFTPNDTLYPNQWNLDIIHASDAWEISEGQLGVVVAVLDGGCDLSHPDLEFSSNGINLGTMSGDGSPTHIHGTPCAGIAAATTNNHLGVAGIAGSCKILPIAFQNWTDAEVAAGIRYGVDNGADVISMSFGQYGPDEGLGPTGWDFSIINPAIEYAYNSQRFVLCAATGNENNDTYNRYPARHDLVIACGASDTDDNRKNKNNEKDWGSNYGEGVSVVAPGVLLPSTDIQGTQGYESGDYTLTFGGTSGATPHVAGLTALILSVCPILYGKYVQDVIERTAEKVGNVQYSTQSAYTNGTRNQEMGYGRINAYEAVKEAGGIFAAWYNLTF